MKKRLTGLLAGVLTIGLLTGCLRHEYQEKTVADGGGNTGESSSEMVTLDVVWFSDGKEGESFQKLAAEYTESHPNIKIELIEVPYGDLDNKLKNMLNAGEQPALARMTNIGAFQNQLLDLYKYVSDADGFKNSFGSGLKYDYDGKMPAAPMDVTANGMIYNKTAFEKAGVSVPQSEEEIWTWGEFEEAIKTVMANSDCKYGMAYDSSVQRLSTLFYQAGGSLLNADLNESNFKAAGNKKGIEWFKRLHEEGVIPTSVWLGSENPNELFRTGQVATHFSGSWMIANYKDQITDFEWGVTYLPKDVQRATISGGKWLGAFQGTGVEQEAADFIEWISQPEQNAQYCVENYYLSQIKGNEKLEYDFGAEYFEIFTNELNATGPQPSAEWGYQAFTNAIQTDMKNKMMDVLADNMTIDEYIESMDKLATESLAEFK